MCSNLNCKLRQACRAILKRGRNRCDGDIWGENRVIDVGRSEAWD